MKGVTERGEESLRQSVKGNHRVPRKKYEIANLEE